MRELGRRPAHAIYFAVYEEAKVHLIAEGQVGYAHLGTAAAGALATIASDCFNVPFDTIKQRLQVSVAPSYRHTVPYFTVLYRTVCHFCANFVLLCQQLLSDRLIVPYCTVPYRTAS
jgi:hypothetical protein